MRRIHALAAGLTGASLFALCAACGDLSATGGGSGGGGSTANSAPAVIAEPDPIIEITQPAAGAFLAPGQVAVAGRVAPAPGSGAAIQTVRLAGELVPVAADGTFTGFVDMVHGMNVIEARCADTRGRTGSAAVGVLAGDWRSVAQPVAEAASVRVTDSALNAIGKLLESTLWSLDLDALLRGANPIYDTNLAWIQLRVDIHQARFRDLSIALDSRTDGIHVRGELLDPDLVVTVLADLGLGAVIGPEIVGLIADRVDIVGRVIPVTLPDGKLRLRFADVALTFQNFRASTNIQVIQTIEPLVRGAVRDALADVVSDLVTEDLQVYLDGKLEEFLTPTQPFQALGKQFLFDIRGEQIVLGDDAVEIRARFDAPAPQPTALGAAAASLGSYRTFGGLPLPAIGPGVFASVDDDAANRLLHGFWANGTLDWDIDEAFLQQQGLTLPIALELGALKQLLPELREAGPDSARVALRLRPKLPPILSVPGAPDLLELALGEVEVSLLVDRGQGYEMLLETACHARVGMSCGLTTDGFKVSTISHPELVFDVRSEPIVELDDRRVEVALNVILTPLFPQLLNGIDVVPIPHLRQLQVFNAQAYPDGPEGDHLSVSGDMMR